MDLEFLPQIELSKPCQMVLAPTFYDLPSPFSSVWSIPVFFHLAFFRQKTCAKVENMDMKGGEVEK